MWVTRVSPKSVSHFVHKQSTQEQTSQLTGSVAERQRSLKLRIDTRNGENGENDSIRENFYDYVSCWVQ